MKKNDTRILLLLWFFTLRADIPYYYTYEPHVPKSSQSYLFTRPAQQNLCLMQTMWHNLLFNKEKRTAFDIALYYQKSTHADKIKAYFLPAYREQLVVSNTALNTDVQPFWLQLPNSFNGVLRIAPQQHQTGFTIAMKHLLGTMLSAGPVVAGVEFFKDWCFIGSISFLQVKNNWNLTQSDVSGAGSTSNPAVYDILTAFDNPEWLYYKSNGPTHQTGISELRLGFLTTLLATRRSEVATYSSILIPFKPNPSLKYAFNAQNGYGHVGLVWGINFQFPFTREDEGYQLTGTINFENIYLIRNHQHRTFDLNGKQWSRFLLLRQQGDSTNTLIPGVNILTHKVRVSPHNIMDFGTGFRLTVKCIEAEVGFGVWGNKGERCRIYGDNWNPQYGIAGTAPNTTASNSTISFIAPNDLTFVPILASDLNMDSGAQTSSVAYKAYGSLGVKRFGPRFDGTFNVGAEAEFPHNPNDVLSTWGVWTAVAFAF